MPCDVKRDGSGIVSIVCSRPTRGRPKPCAFCGRPGGLLCDWPLAVGGTCDASICPKCTTRVGPNRDYCPPHAGKTKGTVSDDLKV